MVSFGNSSANVGAGHSGLEPLIAVEDLSKRYGHKIAVTGVTLTLRAGEVCGFVGANGGGKTTTLRMLAGILRPERARGRVLGCDLLGDAARIRVQVGYMAQRLSLYAELSVLENLRFRAEVYELENPRAAAWAAVDEFSLGPWARRPAGSLSGGWARRFQLAAALIHSPRLVLLNEPTAGLDAAARREVWRRLDILAAAGAGVVICTHDLAEAQRCPRAVYFSDGCVIAAGAPNEIAERSPAAAFLISGTEARRLACDVAATAGVIACDPEGQNLRVVADPQEEQRLRCLAASHGASIARVDLRLEDAMLAWSMPQDGHCK
jgi:ABC-type multidrug transport system ATPase subunit